MVSLASEAAPSDAVLQQHRARSSAAQLLTAYMHESAARFLGSDDKADQPHLTQRELECLKWIAIGKTAWETARILKCSERTINFHVANLNAKLGVANRRHAATRALALGLISL